MPAQTPCVHCRITGFVRWEYVIEGGRVLTQYYCGRCDHSWSVEGEPDQPRQSRPRRRPIVEKPDRSRP